MTTSVKIKKEYIPSWARTVSVGIMNEKCYKKENYHISSYILFSNAFYGNEFFNKEDVLVEAGTTDIDNCWFRNVSNDVKSVAYFYNLDKMLDLLPEKYGFVYNLVFDLQTEQKFLHLHHIDESREVLIKLPENIKINLIID